MSKKIIHTYEAKLEDGTLLYVRPDSDDDFIAEEIFHKHIYDRFFSPSEGSVVIDVGANSGYFAISASRKVGHSGHVVALEPYSRSFLLLEENIALNHIENITPIRVALGSHPGLGHLHVYYRPGRNSLHDRAGSYIKLVAVETVAVKTLPTVVGDQIQRRIDIIKIDTEGSELEVLKGATSLLRRFHPKIALETHGFGSGDAISGFLHAFDYRVREPPYMGAEGLLFAWAA